MTGPNFPDPYDSVRAWYAQTMCLRAHQVEAYGPSAWAIRTPQWPSSYAHNTLVLTADPGAATTLAWVEQALAGLDHRQVMAMCPLSEATVGGLRDAGYEIQPEVLMGRPASAAALLEPAVVVEQVDPYASDVQALQDRLWREEWLPHASQLMVDQLVDRRSELDRAGRAVTFVVRDDDGSPVATLDVTVRDGIAELDGLATLASYRGRGYGQALMARGTAYAVASGADHVVLTALVEDWPRHWYARLGFDTLGPATEATRLLTTSLPPGSDSRPVSGIADPEDSDVAT